MSRYTILFHHPFAWCEGNVCALQSYFLPMSVWHEVKARWCKPGYQGFAFDSANTECFCFDKMNLPWFRRNLADASRVTQDLRLILQIPIAFFDKMNLQVKFRCSTNSKCKLNSAAHMLSHSWVGFLFTKIADAPLGTVLGVTGLGWWTVGATFRLRVMDWGPMT